MNRAIHTVLATAWVAASCVMAYAQPAQTVRLRGTIEKADGNALALNVNRMHLGGGFGRRASSHDFVEQAVLIAKQMPGTPITLIWSREEDMTHGRYHPITQCNLTGGFDAQGNLTALHMRISGQSIVANLLPQLLKDGMDPFVFQRLNPSGTEGVFGYTIPNLLIDHAMRNTHITPGFWRGVNNNQNAIYLECFMGRTLPCDGCVLQANAQGCGSVGKVA